jgi:hypothetical protein
MESGEGRPDVLRDGPTALPPLWPYLLSCAAAALWVDLGTIHRDQHSDSILNVLVSLYSWTPFVWEQDRFGMAVPLLASPIRHPLANLLAQAFLSSFAGLAAFFLLARYAIRDASYPLVGALGAASFLALTPHYYRFEYLVDTSYGIGLSLALWGLILVEPRPRGVSWPGRIGAMVLMAVAHWVNCATALFLGPFVLLRGAPDLGPSSRWLDPILGLRTASLKDRLADRWLDPILAMPLDPLKDRLADLARRLWRTEVVQASLVLAVGYAIGQQLIGLAPYRPTTLAALPSSEWREAWQGLARRTRDALEPSYWPRAMGLELIVGVVGLAWRGWRRSARAWRGAAELVATASLVALLMGTRVWVQINDYEFRYLFPSALMMQTAVAALAMAPLGAAVPSRPRARAGIAVVAAVALLAAGGWSYGRPSLSGVRRDVDRRCGALTDDLLAAHCTHVAGDYWTVWKAVFHANLVLHDRGESRTLWGVTFRAQPTHRFWKAMPMDRRLAGVPVGDGLGEVWLNSYHFPSLEEVEVRPTIRVLRPIPRRASP